MDTSKTKHAAVLILKLCCFFLLAGRAYQCFFWDIPLRTFFWDEGLLKPVIEGLTGSSWQDVITSPGYDRLLMILQYMLGVFWGIAAVGSLFAEKLGKRFAWMLPLSSILLAVLAMLYWKERFFQMAQLFEYSAQVTAPFLLFLMVKDKTFTYKKLYLIGAIAVSLTFVAHGLYAANIYPLPGKFVDMTISILGIDESGARSFLLLMGGLDIVLAVGLFFKLSRKISLYYCIIWGFLTALARVVAYVRLAELGPGMHQYAFETSIRLIHGGLPLLLIFCCKLLHEKKA